MNKTLFNYNEFIADNEEFITNTNDDYYLHELIIDELDFLFNNSAEYQQYILTGVFSSWNGIKRFGYKEEIYNSVKDAILGAISGYDCTYTIYESDYGRLKILLNEHDGTHELEIKELTDKGADLINNWYSVDYLLERAGTTRNVKYLKRYSK